MIGVFLMLLFLVYFGFSWSSDFQLAAKKLTGFLLVLTVVHLKKHLFLQVTSTPKSPSVCVGFCLSLSLINNKYDWNTGSSITMSEFHNYIYTFMVVH